MNEATETYPGQEFAQEHGYTLHSHSGRDTNGIISHATYINGEAIYLDVWRSGKVELTKILGMVVCKVANFAIPNKNFHIFEKQLRATVQLDWRPE
jgi:hypothetical protein